MVINAPVDYLEKLKPLPPKSTLLNKISGSCDFIQYFVSSKSELEKALPSAKKKINKNGSLWVTYPKKSSKIESDLNRDISLSILKEHGFTGVAIISIDETWSALCAKLNLDGTAKLSAMDEKDNFSKYINQEKRIIILPEDLKKKLDKNHSLSEFFNSLAFTNKKEYVRWILDAKKEETRKSRVKQTIEMLRKGAKNPSDKGGK